MLLFAQLCPSILAYATAKKINEKTGKSLNLKQEAFEKCWAHSPLRAVEHTACSNFTLPFTRCRYCRHHYQDELTPSEWQCKIDVHNDNNDNA